MSCSSTGGWLSDKDVEAFVYQDPCGTEVVTPPPTPPPPEERPKEPGIMIDRVPRISEQELSRLLAEARSEGISEGEQRAAASFAEELARERKRVSDTAAAFHEQLSDYYSKIEVELVHFALAIAARILHREAQVDRMVVAGLVKVMLEKLQKGSRVTVRVHPEEAASWRQYFHDNTHLEIVEDSSLQVGDCILETELGTTEMGLDAQLKEIETGFADLLAQRPDRNERRTS
ncbi:MAG TPA: FliH/SctL family protein [Terriglobales bacterium]|nr:FliH/SctL family protein [Terriglobales bacterium]